MLLYTLYPKPKMLEICTLLLLSILSCLPHFSVAAARTAIIFLLSPECPSGKSMSLIVRDQVGDIVHFNRQIFKSMDTYIFWIDIVSSYGFISLWKGIKFTFLPFLTKTKQAMNCCWTHFFRNIYFAIYSWKKLMTSHLNNELCPLIAKMNKVSLIHTIRFLGMIAYFVTFKMEFAMFFVL